MIALKEFEGISGFRWGAQVGADWQISSSRPVDDGMLKQIKLVAKVIRQAPFRLNSLELIFALGKVLVRRTSQGMLLVFCDQETNSSMVDIVIMEHEERATSGDRASASTDSNFSAIQSMSLNLEPVPEPVIADLVDIYTRFLGPLAKVLAQKVARQHQIDLNKVIVKDWSKLLNGLASRISDSEKRESFLDDAVLLKMKF